MQSPLFYTTETGPAGTSIVLDENNSKHAVQVLRLEKNSRLRLTDGKGNLLTALITNDHRKHCTVQVEEAASTARSGPQVTIALSPLKSSSRFEWFLEKATELGVAGIIPLLCHRTEKQQLRMERLQGILVSALLQSQQCWLPELTEPVKLEKLDWNRFAGQQRLIAHCMEGTKTSLPEVINKETEGRLILIGPEGDFTTAELELALRYGCQPVSLGTTRLRTETAAMVAAALARLV